MDHPLSEQGVTQTLRRIVDGIREGRLDTAESDLRLLDFGRLRTAEWEQSNADKDRVQQTGAHLDACEKALAYGHVAKALQKAEAALERWLRR